MCVVYDHYIVLTMDVNKVKFGLISNGKQSVLHKENEFVEHQEYAKERFSGIASENTRLV